MGLDWSATFKIFNGDSRSYEYRYNGNTVIRQQVERVGERFVGTEVTCEDNYCITSTIDIPCKPENLTEDVLKSHIYSEEEKVDVILKHMEKTGECYDHNRPEFPLLQIRDKEIGNKLLDAIQDCNYRNWIK